MEGIEEALVGYPVDGNKIVDEESFEISQQFAYPWGTPNFPGCGANECGEAIEVITPSRVSAASLQ